MQETWVRSLSLENPLGKEVQPSPIFLLGKSHGQQNLVDCNPWGHKGVSHDLATKQQQQKEFIHSVAPISAVQKSESVLHIYIRFFKYSFPLWLIPGDWI